MLGYQLFDMLAWVTGYSGQISCDVTRDCSTFTLPEKLVTLVNCLEDWTTIVPAAQSLAAEAGQQPLSPVMTIQESTAPEWKWTVKNLFHASQQQGKAEWHKILRNFYSVAFVIRWFSLVCLHVCL
jgi:hypothetical protein